MKLISITHNHIYNTRTNNSYRSLVIFDLRFTFSFIVNNISMISRLLIDLFGGNQSLEQIPFEGSL